MNVEVNDACTRFRSSLSYCFLSWEFYKTWNNRSTGSFHFRTVTRWGHFELLERPPYYTANSTNSFRMADALSSCSSAIFRTIAMPAFFFINVTIHSYRRLPFPRIVHSSSSVHYSSKHLYITAALPSPFLTPPPTNHSLLTPAPA